MGARARVGRGWGWDEREFEEVVGWGGRKYCADGLRDGEEWAHRCGDTHVVLGGAGLDTTTGAGDVFLAGVGIHFPSNTSLKIQGRQHV